MFTIKRFILKNVKKGLDEQFVGTQQLLQKLRQLFLSLSVYRSLYSWHICHEWSYCSVISYSDDGFSFTTVKYVVSAFLRTAASYDNRDRKDVSFILKATRGSGEIQTFCMNPSESHSFPLMALSYRVPSGAPLFDNLNQMFDIGIGIPRFLVQLTIEIFLSRPILNNES